MLPFVKGKDTTGKEAETLKRLLALMMVVAVTAALLACTKGGRDNEDGNDTPNPEPQYAGADTMTLRVVGDSENGTLILAGETEVYALPLEGVTLYLDGGSVSASEIESGMSAEVWYTGGVQETYPAKFSQVVAVSLSHEDDVQYDLCGLYLQAHERSNLHGSLHHDLLTGLDVHALAHDQVGISLDLGLDVRHPGTSLLDGEFCLEHMGPFP